MTFHSHPPDRGKTDNVHRGCDYPAEGGEGGTDRERRVSGAFRDGV